MKNDKFKIYKSSMGMSVFIGQKAVIARNNEFLIKGAEKAIYTELNATPKVLTISDDGYLEVIYKQNSCHG